MKGLRAPFLARYLRMSGNTQNSVPGREPKDLDVLLGSDAVWPRAFLFAFAHCGVNHTNDSSRSHTALQRRTPGRRKLKRTMRRVNCRRIDGNVRTQRLHGLLCSSAKRTSAELHYLIDYIKYLSSELLSVLCNQRCCKFPTFPVRRDAVPHIIH